MKKICILSTYNLRHMTLSSLYTDYMDKIGIKYDIIYIDKYHEDEKSNAENVYKFDLYIKKEWSFARKWIHYWKFKKFAKDILLENQYDFIIVWNEFTGYMFADVLKKYFPQKYCLNIRDYHYNNIFFVNNTLKKAIKNSVFATISSEAFKTFLPEHNYLMIHSMNRKYVEKCKPKEKLREINENIEILFIGNMCFPENVYKIIDSLGNDMRYTLNFVGSGTEFIGPYIQDKNITNVKYHGRFEAEQTPDFLESADIIYNLYGVGNTFVDTLLSIKLYYAVYLNIPILVFKGTYMEKISEKCGIGYAIDKDGFISLGDELFTWYHNLSQLEIKHKCESFIEEIDDSHNQLLNVMKENLS